MFSIFFAKRFSISDHNSELNKSKVLPIELKYHYCSRGWCNWCFGWLIVPVGLFSIGCLVSCCYGTRRLWVCRLWNFILWWSCGWIRCFLLLVRVQLIVGLFWHSVHWQTAFECIVSTLNYFVFNIFWTDDRQLIFFPTSINLTFIFFHSFQSFFSEWI